MIVLGILGVFFLLVSFSLNIYQITLCNILVDETVFISNNKAASPYVNNYNAGFLFIAPLFLVGMLLVIIGFNWKFAVFSFLLGFMLSAILPAFFSRKINIKSDKYLEKENNRRALVNSILNKYQKTWEGGKNE